MSTLGKAVITFAADTATFIGDIGKAAAAFERSMGRMQSAVRGLDGPLAKLTAGLSVAGVSLFVKSVIDGADEIGKLSQKVGIGTETLSEYKLAAELGNVSNEQFAKGLRAFNVSLVEASNSSSKASKVFRALGVDVNAGPAEAFRQFAEQMSQLPDGELKTAAAMEILKKSGEDWIPVLNGGSKGLAEAGDQARALGLVISEDFSKSASRFNDNMKLIGKSTVGFTNAILSGGLLDGLVNISTNIEKAAEKGEKWLGVLRELQKLGLATIAAHPGIVTPGPLSGMFPGAEDAIRLQAERAADNLFNPPKQTVTGKIGGLKERAARLNQAVAGPDPAALKAALAENEAEIKRYVSALKGLERQLSGLNNETAEEAMRFELFGRNMTLADGSTVHLEGSLEKLTAAHKVNLLNLSLEVTRREELKKTIDALLPALQAEAAAMERSSEIQKDFALQGRLNSDQIKFETSLLGQSSREQEKANALRQIELELRRKRAELATTAGEDMGLFMRESAKLEAEAKRQGEEAIKLIERRQQAERDWATGAKSAFAEYADAAQNGAAAASSFIGNSFRGAEDSLTSFVTTGKVNFRSLADSIIADLARIEIRKNITGPIAGGLGALFGGSGTGFSSAESAGGVNAAGVPFDITNIAPMALGGIVGPGGAIPLRSYARGGVANSPQLAIFGEGATEEAFVPLPDGRRIPVNLQGGGGRGRAGSTNYIDARGADRQGMAELRALVARLDGSIEERSVAAVADSRQRGGRLSRSIGGSR